MKTLNKLSIMLLGILAFAAFAIPMDSAAAENTNSILSATTNLYTRTFKVDPDSFPHALERFMTNAFELTNNYNGLRGLPNETPNPPEIVSVAARTYFKTLGVDLTAPGKVIFFNDRLGILFVRGTKDDLDTIERAIEKLNMTAQQVHIKALPLLQIIFLITIHRVPYSPGITRLSIASGLEPKMTWVHQTNGGWQATTEDGKDAGLWSVDGSVVSVTTNGQTTKTDLSQFVGKTADGADTLIFGGNLVVYTEPANRESGPPPLYDKIQFSQVDPVNMNAPFAKPVVVKFGYK